MAKAAKKHHVIVGASAAGLAALEAIRGADKDCAVTVLCKGTKVGMNQFNVNPVTLNDSTSGV